MYGPRAATTDSMKKRARARAQSQSKQIYYAPFEQRINFQLQSQSAAKLEQVMLSEEKRPSKLESTIERQLDCEIPTRQLFAH